LFVDIREDERATHKEAAQNPSPHLALVYFVIPPYRSWREMMGETCSINSEEELDQEKYGVRCM
jgi:hypothetical protein